MDIQALVFIPHLSRCSSDDGIFTTSLYSDHMALAIFQGRISAQLSFITMELSPNLKSVRPWRVSNRWLVIT